jgi:hypothetical protein
MVQPTRSAIRRRGTIRCFNLAFNRISVNRQNILLLEYKATQRSEIGFRELVLGDFAIGEAWSGHNPTVSKDG